MGDHPDDPTYPADSSAKEELRVRHRWELEFGSRQQWDDPEARVAPAVLGAARHVLFGACRGRRRDLGRRGSDRPRSGGRRSGPHGDDDHPVHGRDLRRAPEPGRLAGVRPARGLPLEARAGLHHRPARRGHPRCLFLLAVFGNIQHLGATLPGSGYEDWQALLMEIALTAGLVSVILGTASAAQNVGAIAALGVGGYIALAGLWAAPVSGASMNPARSFGPALVSGDFTQLLGLCGRPAGRSRDRRRLRVRPSRTGWRPDRKGSGLRRAVAGEPGGEAATVGGDRPWRGGAARHRRARAARRMSGES